jgi:ABC-type lipoprotein release transport system permease subunit
MALGKLWTIAYRDLGRNRRRSLFTALAVALGLALLIVMNGLITGVMEDSLENSVRLQTGHVQLRANSYETEKMSLQWKDLLAAPATLAARAGAMPEVKAAAPVLWAGGVLSTGDDSAGLQVYGIDTESALYTPIREALIGGSFLAADDRSGILIGKRLADSLGIGTGQKVALTIVDANGKPQEGVFEIRGLFSTGIPSYDDSAAFMPLSKAQAFTGAGDRASAVMILLHNKDDAGQVAAALRSADTTATTWQELNALVIQTTQFANSYYAMFDAIVILIVAVVIANTLLMAVFERIREMGILAALGMKGRQIMSMFLLEAVILGLAGIVAGILIGLAGVAYLANVGIYIGDTATSAGSFALRSTMYGRFVPGSIASLSLWTLVIVLLASLYPAWFAARREPVEALRAL